MTNDDGIDAPGLKIAEDIAAQLAEEVWVVAPEHDQSGVGQGISLHTPLRVYHHGERRFAVSGTPADCVMFAMAEWFEDEAPDLVLSGVNCGANLSDSVMYSGTVGAVLAAAHLGLPGIALSQAFVDRAAIDYAPTTHYA
ncbi:MAG: 5'/3'-nucleotidase SurE, partial [Alloalcanivorax venustensis]